MCNRILNTRVTHARQLIQEAHHPAHLAHLLKLHQHIFKVEGSAFCSFSPFFRLFLCRFCVQLLRPKKVRHPYLRYVVQHDLDGMAQVHLVFTDTQELDRFTCNRTNRKRSTTTCITISFSQNNTSQSQSIVKCFCCIAAS